MEDDDDPFFAGDDDFVWPVSSSSDELSNYNVVGITMCSVPSTPQSSSNDEVANLGFSGERKAEDYEREYVVKLNGDSDKIEDNVVEDVKEDDNKEFRVNLTAKSSLMFEDGNDETEILKEGEKNDELRANSLPKASKLSPKSSLMVEDGNDEIEIITEGEINEGSRVDLAAKASKLEAKSRMKVEDDNNEIEIVKKDEMNKGFGVKLAAKDLKLRTNLETNSRWRFENEVVKEEKKREGFRATKASKLRSKVEEKSSMNALECLIEVLKRTCEIEKMENEENFDILETVTRRGMTFPRPRGYGS